MLLVCWIICYISLAACLWLHIITQRVCYRKSVLEFWVIWPVSMTHVSFSARTLTWGEMYTHTHTQSIFSLSVSLQVNWTSFVNTVLLTMLNETMSDMFSVYLSAVLLLLLGDNDPPTLLETCRSDLISPVTKL